MSRSGSIGDNLKRNNKVHRPGLYSSRQQQKVTRLRRKMAAQKAEIQELKLALGELKAEFTDLKTKTTLDSQNNRFDPLGGQVFVGYRYDEHRSAVFVDPQDITMEAICNRIYQHGVLYLDQVLFLKPKSIDLSVIQRFGFTVFHQGRVLPSFREASFESMFALFKEICNPLGIEVFHPAYNFENRSHGFGGTSYRCAHVNFGDTSYRSAHR